MKQESSHQAKAIFDSLTDEQKELIKECKDDNEMARLLRKEKIPLPDDYLEDVSGGYVVKAPNGEYLVTDSAYVLKENRFKTRFFARLYAFAWGYGTDDLDFKEWCKKSEE